MNAIDRRNKRLLLAALSPAVADLGLERWDIRLRFGPLDDTAGSPAAGCEADERYRVAVVQFDLQQYRTIDSYRLVLDLYHELLHCLNAPMMHLCERLWTIVSEETLERQNVSFERMPLLLKRARLTEQDAVRSIRSPKPIQRRTGGPMRK